MNRSAIRGLAALALAAASSSCSSSGKLQMRVLDDGFGESARFEALPEGVQAMTEIVPGGPKGERQLVYLRSEDPDALKAAVTGKLPAGVELGIGCDLGQRGCTSCSSYRTFWLSAEPGMKEGKVKKAEGTKAPRAQGGPLEYLQIELDSAGAKELERFTSASVGKRLAILVDGVVEAEPYVTEGVATGVLPLVPKGLAEDAWLRSCRVRDLKRALSKAKVEP